MSEKLSRNWSTTDLVQVVASVAVIVGLGLVLLELRQAKDLAYAQIITEETSKMDDRSMSIMGEDPRAALYKASLCPEKLSAEDAVTLDAYYTMHTWNWFRLRRVTEITGIERPWKPVVKNQINLYFSSIPARRWLKEYAGEIGYLRPEVVSLIKTELAARPGRAFDKRRYQTLLESSDSDSICS